MKLRLAQPVDTTDGPFGELGDIIVDPHAGTVTHVVVQPEHQHYQARLVPIWLVSEKDGRLTVDLDTAHLRRMEPVADSDFVRLGEMIDVGEDWDVGTEDISMLPYHQLDLDLGPTSDLIGINFDRIPKGECEIRRTSDVQTVDSETVGHVDGFVAEDDHLTAIVVRVGRPGFRHDILVPFGSVARVRTDLVELSLTEAEFQALPHTEVLGTPDELTARVTKVQRGAATMRTRFSAQSHKLVSAAKDRIGHSGSD